MLSQMGGLLPEREQVIGYLERGTAIQKFCHKSKLESKRGKIPFSDSIKTKARQAIQGDARDATSDGTMRFYGGDSSAL